MYGRLMCCCSLHRPPSCRLDASHRYELPDHGRRIAVFLTKTYTPILTPSLAEPDPTLPRRDQAITACPRLGGIQETLNNKIAGAQLTP
jgi:hypothetical protein